MRILKLIGILIAIAFSIEVVTYLAFSRQRINNHIYKNYETAISNFPDSLPNRKSFYIDQTLSEDEKNEWRQFFKDSDLEFIIYDHGDYEKLKPTMNQFNYAVYADSKLAILDVEESMNVSEYAEVWQSRYIWLFVDWVKIEKVCIGQS